MTFQLRQNPDNNAILLLSRNSPDYHDYAYAYYDVLHSGSKRACLDALDNYWYETNTDQDSQIYLDTTKTV